MLLVLTGINWHARNGRNWQKAGSSQWKQTACAGSAAKADVKRSHETQRCGALAGGHTVRVPQPCTSSVSQRKWTGKQTTKTPVQHTQMGQGGRKWSVLLSCWICGSFLVTALPVCAIKTPAGVALCAREQEEALRAGAGRLPEGLQGWKRVAPTLPLSLPSAETGQWREMFHKAKNPRLQDRLTT